MVIAKRANLFRSSMGKPEKPKVKTKPEQQQELPWDLFDRCLLPVIFSHAIAVIISTILNVLYISQISSFALFLLFLILSIAGVVFYHNLKVTISRGGRGGGVPHLKIEDSSMLWQSFTFPPLYV